MTGILSLVQDAADELSLARPADLVDVVNDATGQKFKRHLTRTCRQLASSYDWAKLKREHVFPATATEVQAAAFQPDFLRFVDDTIWNRTTRTKILGPLTQSDWQARKAVLVNGPFQNFMVRGTSFLLTPTPSAGWAIAYEYITKNIGFTIGGAELASFASDDDETFFDDELVILGIVWRYRKAEGLDYSEEFREYQMRRADMIKMDGGRRILDMNNTKTDRPVNTTYTEIEDIFTV